MKTNYIKKQFLLVLSLVSLCCVLSLICYVVIRTIRTVTKDDNSDPNNTLQALGFLNFTGDDPDGQQVAVLTTRFTTSKDDWDNAISTIGIYAHGKKLAEDNNIKAFGPSKLYARKPDTANNNEYLFSYGSAGAHGWNLSVYGLHDGKLTCPICSENQSSSCTFAGDGGVPDFGEIVNDFNNDGKLEIQEINRDWEYNSTHPNEPIRYSKEIRYSWNGSCFTRR